jgi:hypothetical protein
MDGIRSESEKGVMYPLPSLEISCYTEQEYSTAVRTKPPKQSRQILPQKSSIQCHPGASALFSKRDIHPADRKVKSSKKSRQISLKNKAAQSPSQQNIQRSEADKRLADDTSQDVKTQFQSQ